MLRYTAASVLFLVTPAVAVASPAPPPQTAAFDRATARAAVEALAAALERDFVDPDTGTAYARMLRARLAAGAWSDAATPEAFAAAVTRDLHAIQYDGHLGLRPPATGARSPGVAGPSVPGPRVRPPAMEKAGWISPGIAYVRFNAFTGEPATLEALRAFLAEHRSARTLIVDARTHAGGGLDEMDVMFPLLFARPATLVRMDMRESVELRNGPLLDNASLVRVDGPKGVIRREHRVDPAPGASPLRDAEVFVLTSGRTASAAEHFALAMKRTRRATLIGETTAGAGNFGSGIELPGGFSAFIPSGRTFDPDTDKGWDGVGVAPDVPTPAAGALAEALMRAGVERDRAAELSDLYRPSLPMERRTPPAREARPDAK